MSETENETITPPQPRRPDLSSGVKLGERFILKDRVEWGADPLVLFTATDETTSKDCILAFLPEAVLADPAALKELRNLARLNRRLIHPNIVRIHELVEEPQWAAILMDFAEGESLALARLGKEKHIAQPEEAGPWIARICQTLHDASQTGLLHLDVAPANLILSNSGALRVANFRVTRCAQDAVARAVGQATTSAGRLSPQRMQGEAPSQADDVYSLGILIFELLTGELPFAGKDIKSEARDSVPPLLSERRRELGPVPESWDRAVAACLEKDPSKRPRSVLEVAEMLEGKIRPDAISQSAGAGATISGIGIPPGPDTLAEAVTQTKDSAPGSTKHVVLVPSALTPTSADTKSDPPVSKSRFPGLAMAAVAILAALIGAAVFLSNKSSEPAGASSPTPAPQHAQSSPSPAMAALPQPSITPPVSEKERARQELEAAQAEVSEKSKALFTGKQIADELANQVKPLREEQDRTETDAHAAQEVAAQKAHTADEAKKAADDTEAKAKAAALAVPQLEKALQKAQDSLVARRLAAKAAGTTAGGDSSEKPNAVLSGSGKIAAPGATAAPESAASPVKLGKSPTLSILAVNQRPTVSKTLVNSLGMRFAPVGNVLFGIWPVRVRDFAEFAKASGFASSAWKDPGFEQAPDHPVVYVSWDDAMSFCKWLTEKERKDGTLAANQYYRLPTDLEWSKGVGLQEEAGGTPESHDMDITGVFPWGTQWPPPPRSGNYTGEETNSEVAIHGYNDGYPWTSPVGAFPPNKLGLYDMGGNVSQWVMDSWNSEQRAKVLRGGSWYNGALRLSLLSSCRVHAPPETSTDNWGFRCVVAPLKSASN